MQVLSEDKERKIIPRWRSFKRETALGELKPLTENKEPLQIPGEYLDDKLDAWNKNKTLAYAIDLISAALVLGRESEVSDAAKFILKTQPEGNEVGHILAKRVLGIRTTSKLTNNTLDINETHQDIHNIKRRLHEEPRNIFLWNDLALQYESLGLYRQSEKAMNIALFLSPECRYILRSASRLYIHHENGRLAHKILWANKRTLYDPWLLSAEIAVASAIGRTSKFIKSARRMIESNNFAPFHISELSSAIATLEFEVGNTKNAKKFFERSMLSPTENAVAQAAWAHRMNGNLKIELKKNNKAPISHEALAWDYNQRSLWNETIEEAYKWLSDQPFSSRPAILGSYIASVAKQDYVKSFEISERGLIANPFDFTLINNYAYAATQLNQIQNAKREFSKINPTTLNNRDKVAWLATSGLIHYREGLIERGRQFYLESLELAKLEPDPKLRCLALINFAREEHRANSENGDRYRKEAVQTIEHLPFPDLKPFLNILKVEN